LLVQTGEICSYVGNVPLQVSARVFYRDDFMRITNLMATSALVGMMTFSGAAYAQGAKPAADAAEETIIVTGSRIPRPNLQSTAPILSVIGAEFFETGEVSVGDKLNDLPQLRTSFGQQQSGGTNSGINLLDLRGLGSQRTLVLVNGRRHIGGDLQINATSVDTNTIPTALIERIDIVTGGNSSIYGSDAIAGVVNFVTKRSFSGIEVRGQGGISRYNDANAYFGSVTAGKNFADDRGNIAVSLEYSRQNRYFGSNRPFASQDGYITVDTDPAGSLNGGDGVFDTKYFTDIRSTTTSNQGLVVFDFGSAGPTAAQNCGADAIGGFFTCPYQFQADGTLVPLTGTRVGIGPNGSFVGGNGENFRSGEQYELSPQVDRLVGNLLARYELSSGLELFGEFKYARVKSIGTGNFGPGFIVSAGNAGDVRQMFRLDNPFLSTQAKTLITSQLLTTGRSTGSIAGVGGALSATDITNINNGSYRVRLAESFLNLGRREQNVTRETFRAVVGLRGTVNDDWKYEVSANYAEFKENETRKGNINRQRLLLALDAVSSGGAIKCRSQVDPAAAVGLSTAGADLSAAQRASILAADVAACVPLNPFGGQYTPAMVDYIISPTTGAGKMKQFVANAYLSGDSSGQFEFQGGPLGFAMGLEYRRETNSYGVDFLSSNGYTVIGASLPYAPPVFEVKEAFGELRAPLIANKPFFEELTLSGAVRYALYSGSTGGVAAYNGGLDYAPVPDIRFRVNYSRAVRAPLLSELYAAQATGFISPIPQDPCSLRFRGQGTTNRAANCLAAGVPAAYDFVYASTPVGTFGGNPNLKAESSNSWTFGAVVQPRWIPGLSLSVDYYNIKLENVIAAVTPQIALQQCVDLPSLNNQFCALFKRNIGPGVGPAGEEVGRVIEGSYLNSILNFASRRARGIDVEAAYRHTFNFGTIDFRANWTHVLQRSNFPSPTDPAFEDVIAQEIGDPIDDMVLRTSLKTGRFDLTYGLHYIGKMYFGTYESVNSTNGLPPTNIDQYPNDFYPATFYHDIRVGYNFPNLGEIYVGVNNVANTLPPLGASGIGAGSGIYDSRGRFMYAGFKVKF
jgi:outer membrane receptor protein involved in Fe transport